MEREYEVVLVAQPEGGYTVSVPELIEARQDGMVDLSRDNPNRAILLVVSDPSDQAWIERLFGHIKGEWPHLDAIKDPAVLRAELARVRIQYNTVCLHADLGNVTPDDEHEGRGPAIRRARKEGLEQARLRPIAYHQNQSEPRAPSRPTDAD